MIFQKQQEIVFLSLCAAFEINKISLDDSSYLKISEVTNQSLDNIYFELISVLKSLGYVHQKENTLLALTLFADFSKELARFSKRNELDSFEFSKNLMFYALEESRESVIHYFNDPESFNNYYGYVDLTKINRSIS